MKLFLPVVASLLAGPCSAMPNLLPEPTLPALNAASLLFGWTPRPTDGPSFELIKARGLLERRVAASSSLVGYVAPDRTCGYVSGALGNVIQCSTGSTCVAVAPIATNPGAVGCCDSSGDNCYFNTRCFNSAQIYSSSLCDQACQQDVNIHFWYVLFILNIAFLDSNNNTSTSSASPFCFAYTWADISVTSWGCVASAITTRVPVQFTFNGEGTTDNRVWSPLFDSATATSGSATSQNPIASQLSTAQSNASSSTSTSTSSSSSPSATGGGGGSKTNVGAIAGGVVGGIAVIAIAAVVAFLLISRSHRNHTNNAANGGIPPSEGPPHTGPQYANVSPVNNAPIPNSHNPVSPAMSTAAPSTLGGGAMAGQSYYASDGKPLSGNTTSPGGYQQSERTSIFSEGTGITGSSPGTQQANLHAAGPQHGVEMPGSAPPVVHEIG
jgi:hypothetical protein